MEHAPVFRVMIDKSGRVAHRWAGDPLEQPMEKHRRL